MNNVKAYGNQPYTIRVKLWLPEGFRADKQEFDIFAPHWTPFTTDCLSEEVEVTIKAEENVQSVNRILLEIGAINRYTKAFAPVFFVAK